MIPMFLQKLFRHPTFEQILQDKADKIRSEAKAIVKKETVNLDISSLEIKALSRIRKLCKDETTVRNIKNKLNGVIPLLEWGESTFLAHSGVMKERNIATAILQPFGNATEIMIYIAFVHISEDDKLGEFIDNHTELVRPKDKKPVYYWVNNLENEALKSILRDYRDMRNLAAHTYQIISIKAAQSFVYRTYENIQRLELMINPMA